MSSLIELGPTVFGDISDVIGFLRQKNLLSSNLLCLGCNSAMDETVRKDTVDQFTWWCPRCRSRRTIREGSIFFKSRVPLFKWVLLIHFWAKQYPVTDAAEEVAINQITASKIYDALRRICGEKLRQHPISLGGSVAQSVVQIDDSCFSHKPKYHRGRRATTEQWVLGLVDTAHRPALGYMEVVSSRSPSVLFPIIQSHVQPNTTVHTDDKAAYSSLQQLPNVALHQTVNHTYNFVDPVTGAHTQHIESYWARVKYQIKQMKGIRKERLHDYLNEFMWRERYGSPKSVAFDNIIADIAAQYPV